MNSAKKTKEKAFYIWEGIYKKFEEAPNYGEGFESDRWLRALKKKTLTMIKAPRNGYKEMLGEKNRNASLSILIATLLKDQKHISVLDFGGGLGIDYFQAIQNLPIKDRGRIDFHVVENERVCRLGKKLFGKIKKIKFSDSLPTSFKPDIIHISSSLPCVNEWQKLLEKFVKYKPRYFLFLDLHAGNFPTYASVQNYYGSKMPCWFFNLNQVIKLMDKLGYKPLFVSRFVGYYLGIQQEAPQGNFPKKFRAGHTYNLLFSKNRR
jgi:putative methyltransferase (TIGR04325 family)